MKDYAISKEFEHNGKRYCVVECDPSWQCFHCAFADIVQSRIELICNAKDLACDNSTRTDLKDVYFEEVKQ